MTSTQFVNGFFPDKFHCKSCPESFETAASLEDHVQLIHAGRWCGFDHAHAEVFQQFPGGMEEARAFVNSNPLLMALQVGGTH